MRCFSYRPAHCLGKLCYLHRGQRASRTVGQMGAVKMMGSFWVLDTTAPTIWGIAERDQNLKTYHMVRLPEGQLSLSLGCQANMRINMRSKERTGWIRGLPKHWGSVFTYNNDYSMIYLKNPNSEDDSQDFLRHVWAQPAGWDAVKFLTTAKVAYTKHWICACAYALWSLQQMSSCG